MPPRIPLVPLLVLLAGLAALPCLAEVIGPNLLLDGGLESWNETGQGSGGWDYLTVSLKGWTFSRTAAGQVLTPTAMSQSAAPTGLLQRVTDDVHGGQYAMRFRGGVYLNGATPEAFQTAEGYEYVLRYWVKGAGDTTCYLHVYGEGSPGTEIVSREGKPDPDKWTMISERLRVSGKGAVSVFPRLTCSADMLMDDFFLARVLADEDQPLTPVNPDSATRIAMAPAITAPPKIDGMLGDEAWKQTLPYGGMRWLDNEQVLAPVQARFRILHDDANVYVGLEMPEPGAAALAAEMRKKLPANPMDAYEGRHSIELFWQPPGTAAYFQFAYCLDGARYDGRAKDADWNGTWEVAGSSDDAGWTVEMKLPVKDFGLARVQPGGEWGFNLCWNREVNYSTWSAVGFFFHNPFAFGRVVMSDWGTWARASEAAWKIQADEITRRAPAAGLEVGERLARLQQVAARTQATGPPPASWEDLTRTYGRVQFVNNGYRALLHEIDYLTMFRQAGGKGQ